jgi:ABC-type microcin C transport system duplicated ATPase subunit YejF
VTWSPTVWSGDSEVIGSWKIILHADVSADQAKARAIEVFDRVGFPDPKRALVTYRTGR